MCERIDGCVRMSTPNRFRRGKHQQKAPVLADFNARFSSSESRGKKVKGTAPPLIAFRDAPPYDYHVQWLVFAQPALPASVQLSDKRTKTKDKEEKTKKLIMKFKWKRKRENEEISEECSQTVLIM